MEKILITGATGFKGAWLCNWLVYIGAKVYGIGFDPNQNENLFYKLKLNKKIRVAKDVYYTPSFSPYIAEFLFYVINENEKIFKKKLIHFHSNNYSSLSNFIKKLAKMINKSHLVISVKDDFFKPKNIKPKNLGLKSKYHLSFWKKNKFNIDDKNLIKYIKE